MDIGPFPQKNLIWFHHLCPTLFHTSLWESEIEIGRRMSLSLMSLETSTRVGGYSRLQPREAKAAFRSRSSCIALLFTASLFRYSTYSSTVEEMLREQNHFFFKNFAGIVLNWDREWLLWKLKFIRHPSF